MNKQAAILVWDMPGTPPAGDWIAVCWRGNANSNDSETTYLSALVEQHAAFIRARYLAWIYELGETEIDGKSLVDHLELRPGLSFWWMTLLVEKSYAKSTRLYDIARLFALEKFSLENATRGIELATGDRELADVIHRWCENTGMHFQWRQPPRPSKAVSLRSASELLPHVLRAILSLARYAWQRLLLGGSIETMSSSDPGGFVLVDDLAHLNRDALTHGPFASHYWTGLAELLSRRGPGVHWLHMYAYHANAQSPKEAGRMIERFNQENSSQSHAILDTALDVALFFRIFRDYVRLVWRGFRLRKIRSYFRVAGSGLDFWPLLNEDWSNSIRGSAAMWNCTAINLFERIFSKLPRQRIGMYLLENQGWERALIHAWRASGHGRLIGIQHATIRYWDLRYFYDPRCYVGSVKNRLPMPDQVAINGPIALAAYREGGYPKGQLVETEALRYLYLEDLASSKLKDSRPDSVFRILVCGDILPQLNKQMLEWLESAAGNMPSNTRYIVKPHPGCPISVEDYPNIGMEITIRSLGELLAESDVVFTSNITSAAVDAYCAGIPVIQVLDGNAFNMSALRGLKCSVFVGNPQELIAALRAARTQGCTQSRSYFFVDRQLPRWRRLLDIPPDQT